MDTDNRAGRRKAAKAAGVKGQLVAELALVPEPVTAVTLAGAILGGLQRVEAKGGAPALPLLRRAVLNEGLSVQTLHVGSYDDEAPVLDALHHEFIPSQSLRMTGKHHEIYLSDARRTAPARLRTILRQPVTR